MKNVKFRTTDNAIYCKGGNGHGLAHLYKAQKVNSTNGGTSKVNWFHKYGEEQELDLWDTKTDEYTVDKYYHYRPAAVNALNVFSNPNIKFVYNQNFDNGCYINAYYSMKEGILFVKGIADTFEIMSTQHLKSSDRLYAFMDMSIGRSKQTHFVAMINVEADKPVPLTFKINDKEIIGIPIKDVIKNSLDVPVRYGYYYKGASPIYKITATYDLSDTLPFVDVPEYSMEIGNEPSIIHPNGFIHSSESNTKDLLQLYNNYMELQLAMYDNVEDILKFKDYSIVLKYDKKVEPYKFFKYVREPNAFAVYADTNYGPKIYVKKLVNSKEEDGNQIYTTWLTTYYDPIYSSSKKLNLYNLF